jgi:group I intron endonuclease
MGYIYKITNTISKKCYIGETIEKNPITRWNGHKNAIARGGGCPALRDAVKKYGIDVFTFEVILTCPDEERFTYEKEYIQKYNSRVPNGYNISPGGEGGREHSGFYNKTHTEETRKKLSESIRQFHVENPNHYETYREKHTQSMEKVDISSAVLNSEKWLKALEEGRVGVKAHTEETKDKIRETLLKHYEETTENKTHINIEKRREIMAAATGRRVVQCTSDGTIIKEYKSIAEAGRESGVKKSNISIVLSGENKTAGGYIWKYIT